MAGWLALALSMVFVAAVLWAWRVFSWPCPSWLVPLLENPYFQTVASAETLIGRAGVEAGMSVLDAGCGPGRLTLPIAARVGPSGHVTALDLQAGMLQRVERRLHESGISHVETVHAGLGEGRLPKGRFEVAFLVTVLGEVPEPQAAIEEIAESLLPGGCLSITEVLPDPHYQPVSRVRALAGKAGLVESQIWTHWHGFTINLKPAQENASASARSDPPARSL